MIIVLHFVILVTYLKMFSRFVFTSHFYIDDSLRYQIVQY